MSFFRNAAGILLTSAVGIPIGIATQSLLARALSVNDRGVWAVAVNFASLLVLFGNLGFAMSSVYRIRRMGSPPAEVMTAGIVTTAGLSVAILAVCFVGQDFFTARFLEGAPSLVFWLAVAGVPLQLYLRHFSYVAKGVDLFGLRNWSNFAAIASRLALLALVLLVFDGEIVAALWANLLAGGAVVIVMGVLLVRHTGLSRRVEWVEVREGMRFGLKNYVQSMAGQLHEQIDIAMMGYLLTAKEPVAVYGIAVGVISQLKVIPESIGLALFPKLAGESPEEAGRFTAYVSRHSLALVLCAAVGLAAMAPFLVPLLYGEPYRESLTPLFILVPAMVMLTVYRVLARYFIALGRQQVNIVSQIASVVVNVALNLWLIPSHGAIGAAISSLVSYTFEAVFITIAFVLASRQTLRATFVFRPVELEVYRSRWRRVVARLRRGR